MSSIYSAVVNEVNENISLLDSSEAVKSSS